MHVDLQPKSPLFCLQGSGPPGLGHYALKVEASGKVALSIAGCLLQVSFPAYCFKPISLQLTYISCYPLWTVAPHQISLCMLVSLQDAEYKNYQIREDTRQLKLKTALCMQATSGLGNALSKCHITHEVRVIQCLSGAE